MKNAVAVLSLVLAGSIVAWAQASLTDFPVGVTAMKWTAKGEASVPPQELILVVEGKGGGVYRTELTVRVEGSAADLGTFGFLGSALFVQAFGTTIDLNTLQVLIRRKEALVVGEQYSLPGGTFKAVRKGTIANVNCLIGEYRSVDRPAVVVELGLSLSDPVYFLPLLRVVDGGKVTFEMVLISYTRP